MTHLVLLSQSCSHGPFQQDPVCSFRLGPETQFTKRGPEASHRQRHPHRHGICQRLSIRQTESLGYPVLAVAGAHPQAADGGIVFVPESHQSASFWILCLRLSHSLDMVGQFLKKCKHLCVFGVFAFTGGAPPHPDHAWRDLAAASCSIQSRGQAMTSTSHWPTAVQQHEAKIV